MSFSRLALDGDAVHELSLDDAEALAGAAGAPAAAPAPAPTARGAASAGAGAARSPQASPGGSRRTTPLELDAELDDDDLELAWLRTRRRFMHPYVLGAIVASWNSVGSVLLFPSVVGLYGYFSAILFVLVVQSLANLVAMHMIALVLFYGELGAHVRSFGRLGQRLFGRAGLRLFQGLQLCAFIMMLPYFLSLLVFAVQSLLPADSWMQCNARAGGVLLAAILLLVQVAREWKHWEWLFLASYGLVFLLMAVLCTAPFFQDESFFGAQTPMFVGMPFHVADNCTLTVSQSAWAVGVAVDGAAGPLTVAANGTFAAAPGNASGAAQANVTGAHATWSEPCRKPAEQYAFLRLMQGLSVIVYSFTPALMVVELTAQLEHPERDAKWALNCGFWLSTGPFLIVGVLFALQWGNQIPSVVLTALAPGTWQRVAASVLVLASTVSDLTVTLIIVNRQLFALLLPKRDPSEFSCRGLWAWLGLTLLSCSLALLLPLLVPYVTLIISLVNGTCVLWVQFFLPTLFSLPALQRLGRGTDNHGAPLRAAMSMPRWLQALFWTLAVLAAFFSLVELFAVGYQIVALYRTLKVDPFSLTYWCELVLGTL